MAFLFELPVSILLLLLGLLWQPKREEKHDENGNPVPMTAGETFKILRLVGMRLLILLIGAIGVVYNLVAKLGGINAWGSFGIYLAVYTLLVLMVQRALPKSRILVLLMMSVVGLLVWRMADYRGEFSEHHWGLLAACGVNWLFWYFIGRHHTPQDQIVVYTNK